MVKVVLSVSSKFWTMRHNLQLFLGTSLPSETRNS